MALGNTIDSFMNMQRPQENQYLQSNPATDPNANTSWMDPTQTNPNSGFSGMGSIGGANPVSGPVSGNGTALGAISAGGMAQPQSQAPLGFDQTKWNDPNQGTSNKYIAGRMAAEGKSIEEIAQRLGAKVISPDAIQFPDGFIADLWYDYGGPNQRVQYTQVPGAGSSFDGRNDGTQGTSIGSFMNKGQNAGGMNSNQNMQQFMNQLMQQVFAAKQGQRDRFLKGPNQSGGFVPPTGGFSGYESGMPPSGLAQTPAFSMGEGRLPNPEERLYFGGGIIDPVTGVRRQPRPGEPQ